MTSPSPPPVERAVPPALLTRVGNPVLTWLLGGPRRSAKVGQNLLLLHVTGRRSGRVYSTPVAYHRQLDLDRAPTHDEMADAARRSHLSVILLDVAEESA